MFRAPISTPLLVAFVCTWCAAGEPTFPRGWRGDGSGAFPSSNPPVEWSETKNVLWRTEMPAKSNSQPLIVGDRVFTLAESNALICLDRNDGKILWQKTNSYRDIVGPEEWKKVEAELEVAENLRDLERKTNREIRKAQNTLKSLDADSEQAAELRALVKLRKVREEKLKEQLEKFPLAAKWRTLPTHKGKNGYTTATPVTDGKLVWAVFGNAVVCCYTLDGERRWIKRMSDSPHNMFGHSASPLVVGGKLIVNIEDAVALDKQTGKELWRTGWGQSWGSPIHVEIGGEDFIALANGRILRASDGKQVARAPFSLSDASPIADGGALYYVQNRGGAVKLPSAAGDKLELETLWKTRPKDSRYFSSPVLHDGLIYTASSKHIFTVIDAADGKVVYQRRLNVGGGTGYPSVSAAGGLIYASGDNGTTVVVKPGRTYQEAARNELDGFISTPVFADNRMYLRTHKYLYCIGAK